MNINQEKIDDLNAVIKIELEKKDYDSRVSDVLNDYRKKAVINGFRPGKVPMGMINKMYRKPVVVDEVNKLVSESLYNYIKDNEVNILGEPLPSEEFEAKFDIETEESFEFAFDVALAPEFEVSVSAKDKIPAYKIKVDKKAIDTQVENLRERAGELIDGDKVAEKDLVKGSLVELTKDGDVLEGGIFVEEATIGIDIIKDDKIKKQFLGNKVGDKIDFDIRKAFPNDTEIKGILKLETAEAASEVKSTFRMELTNISTFKKAEVNQEFFDKVMGPDKVKSEEEFRNSLKEQMEQGFAKDSEYRFSIDAKETLVKKSKFTLPEEFLKRWLLSTNKEKYTKEQLDKDFPSFEDDLKWQLIRDKIIKENELKIEADDILAFAKQLALSRYQQYGLYDVPEEHLEEYAKKMLEDENERRNIIDGASQNIVIKFIRENAKVEEKEITTEKFNKLFE